MKIYRAGIIGTGFIGAVHIETLRRLGNVDVVALTDKCNAKETAEKLNVPFFFSDYKKMIDTMDLDTVHICIPNNTHITKSQCTPWITASTSPARNQCARLSKKQKRSWQRPPKKGW